MGALASNPSTACTDMAYIDTKQLIKHPINAQRRETIDSSDQKGKSRFHIGKICKDICFTLSQCQFTHDYQACLHYSERKTLLIFGLKGYSSFYFADSPALHTIRQGDIWLINIANDEHLYRHTPAGQANEMLTIKYASERLTDAFSGDVDESAMFIDKISRLGHQAYKAFGLSELINNTLDTTTKRLIAESQALELLARWIAPNKKVQTKACTGSQKLPSSEIEILKKIVDIITSDIVRPPSLQQLAAQANMSHTKLNRCFKKVYGATVYCWLRNYRLERARYYLDQPASSITNIAFQCGFSSASHFAHAFKQQYGCSPIEYRAKTSSALPELA
ncbi:MAG: AraC family transcriptional regulator [Pseudomonadota bacterium]